MLLVILIVAVNPFADETAGPDGDAPSVLPIDFEDGFERPDGGGPAAGRIVTVPEGAESLVLSAGFDDILTVRIGTEGEPGEWVELAAEPDEAPDHAASEGERGEGRIGGAVALPPLLIEPGSDRLEIVRPRVGQDADAAPVTATFLVAPTSAGRPSVAGRQQLNLAGLSVVPRTSWTADGWASQNSGCESGPWYADNLQAVVVHHTVTGNSYTADQVDDLLRAMHYAHVTINGWCDLGYNFLVDRFGTIWEGRSGGVDRPVIGGHAKGFNTGVVGVALLGQHQHGARPTAASPSAGAQAAITSLADWKLRRYGVDPLGMTWLKNRSTSAPHRHAAGHWHRVPTVMGHRDLGLTSCPGSLSMDFVRGVGPALAASAPGDPSERFSEWTPLDHGPGFVLVDRSGDRRVAGAAAVAGMGLEPSPPAGPSPQPSPAVIAVDTTGKGSATAGYVLHADGVLHPFGSAPGVADRPAGDQRPVDVALADGGGGWVISELGGVHGFGGRGDLASPQSGLPTIVRADVLPSGDGYLLSADGGLRPVGGAQPSSIGPAFVDAIDVAVRSSGVGGWVLDRSADLHPFGGAPAVAVDSPGGLPNGLAVSAVVAADSGRGGWVLSTDGQLWPFGGERLVLPLATDTAGAGLVDVAATGSLVPSEFLTGPAARYIDGLNQLFLGRPASPTEIDYWDGWLTYRGGRRPIATELARSAEWAGRSIQNMYQDVLGRPADPAGLEYWLDQIASGVPIQEIGVYFYGSSEYVASSGSPAAYVQRLYGRLLGRDSDEQGLAYWTSQLDAGQAEAPDIAAAFYSSIESRNQRVRGLYQSVLGRGPDSAGAEYWAQRLAEVDDVILAAELAVSDEFYLLTLE